MLSPFMLLIKARDCYYIVDRCKGFPGFCILAASRIQVSELWLKRISFGHRVLIGLR